MNDKFIGVFDSGIGGLTVVKSITEAMPDENIIYFGDTAHVPYGSRPKAQITELVLNNVKFLSSFDVKAVVIACNTADSVARSKIEELYPLPVFGVVEPASQTAAKTTRNNKIGVIATAATVNSGSYERKISTFNPDAKIISTACPKLVPLVEQGKFNKGDKETEKILAKYLAPLKEQGIDTLVLGCTHYPLLTDIISDIMPEVSIVSSSLCAVNELKKSLKAQKLERDVQGGERKYFVSGDADSFENLAKVFMGNLGGNVYHTDI